MKLADSVWQLVGNGDSKFLIRPVVLDIVCFQFDFFLESNKRDCSYLAGSLRFLESFS